MATRRAAVIVQSWYRGWVARRRVTRGAPARRTWGPPGPRPELFGCAAQQAMPMGKRFLMCDYNGASNIVLGIAVGMAAIWNVANHQHT